MVPQQHQVPQRGVQLALVPLVPVGPVVVVVVGCRNDKQHQGIFKGISGSSVCSGGPCVGWGLELHRGGNASHLLHSLL